MEEIDIQNLPDGELFGHMIRIGLALTENPRAPSTPEREASIRRYDEIVAEMNRRQDLRRKAK